MQELTYYSKLPENSNLDLLTYHEANQCNTLLAYHEANQGNTKAHLLPLLGPLGPQRDL